MRLTIYGDKVSGNCRKVLWVVERLGLDHAWIDVDVVAGGARRPEFIALHAGGQTPAVLLADGRPLAQSNAIMLHLAEGTDLIPADAYARAKMFEWLFWEQYSHEPVIAVRRYHKALLGRSDEEIDPTLLPRGLAVLGRMERVLEVQPWFAGEGFSLADVALVAYTRWAPEGGFTLQPFPAVRDWIGRVERTLPIVD